MQRWFWSWGQGRSRLAFGVALVAGAATIAGAPRRAHGACYVAFVHGKRDAKPTVAQVDSYWNPDPSSTTYSFPHYASDVNGCTKLIVRWDSSKSFTVGAADVAVQIRSFITMNEIPNGQLILIAHSMGGLVTRYILNNWWWGGDFAKVSNATKYLITSQTPHLGTKAADAISSDAHGGLYGNVVAFVAKMTQGRTGSSDAMRRVEMEYASTLGGWMNDAFRGRRIYTIEGYQTGSLAGPTSGVGSQNTTNLDLAWGSLCYKPHIINFNRCPWTPGDGLVETTSARGEYSRSGTWDGTRNVNGKVTNYYDSDTALQPCIMSGFPGLTCKTYTKKSFFAGARTRWLDYGGDHQQGAWDRFKAPLHNYLNGTEHDAYLASYIGANGHDLPL